MPGWLQAFAKANPITVITGALMTVLGQAQGGSARSQGCGRAALVRAAECLADGGQAVGDDAPPGPTWRARRYRAVPGRLRGQAARSGDGRQAWCQAPDAIG